MLEQVERPLSSPSCASTSAGDRLGGNIGGSPRRAVKLLGLLISHISRFIPLTCLNIGACPSVTDAGLAHVSQGLTALTILEMEGCWLITDGHLALASLYILRLRACHHL